ncbi:DUF2635 domain-containing protein [Chitinibacter sp. ZOR0017]|uniref:DUF2635 domain-containing protein n=1 Tax=Chitinibacter sp. ZOR0017 TaxID=1339254 RepID=UPI000648E8FC|nr:DUF2635 domain-containing protein [Chitinibacter sp. ZOR0017]
MNVIAAPGLEVPMEEKPRVFITDAAAVDVPETIYYQRRLLDGDLLLATASAEAQGVKTTRAASAD